MRKIVFNAPINGLSFGNVSFNLLREMYRRDMEVVLFPISDRVDFSAFAIKEQQFADWLNHSMNTRYRAIKRNLPTLKLWHISGSESKLTDQQFLYTFYELNRPTDSELNVLKLHDHTFFSSKYSSSIFELSGLDQKLHSVAPLGFDEDFRQLTDTFYEDGTIHWGLMGKWEKRKRTKEIISTWIKKYGGNPQHVLSCCVANPFYKPEEMNMLIADMLKEHGGKLPFNVNFINRMKTNAEVNNFMNALHVDLTGLSGAEGFNLPAFNCCALGKQVIVLNATAHKDWATKDNAILVDIDGSLPAADGKFFAEGHEFNQGSIYTWSEESVLTAFEEAEKRVAAHVVNEAGIKLQEEFTYKKTLDNILSVIKDKCN